MPCWLSISSYPVRPWFLIESFLCRFRTLGCWDAYYLKRAGPLLKQHNTIITGLLLAIKYLHQTLLHNVHICHCTGWVRGSWYWEGKRQKLRTHASPSKTCARTQAPQYEKSVIRFFHATASGKLLIYNYRCITVAIFSPEFVTTLEQKPSCFCFWDWARFTAHCWLCNSSSGFVA